MFSSLNSSTELLFDHVTKFWIIRQTPYEAIFDPLQHGVYTTLLSHSSLTRLLSSLDIDQNQRVKSITSRDDSDILLEFELVKVIITNLVSKDCDLSLARYLTEMIQMGFTLNQFRDFWENGAKITLYMYSGTAVDGSINNGLLVNKEPNRLISIGAQIAEILKAKQYFRKYSIEKLTGSLEYVFSPWSTICRPIVDCSFYPIGFKVTSMSVDFCSLCFANKLMLKSGIILCGKLINSLSIYCLFNESLTKDRQIKIKDLLDKLPGSTIDISITKNNTISYLNFSNNYYDWKLQLEVSGCKLIAVYVKPAELSRHEFYTLIYKLSMSL